MHTNSVCITNGHSENITVGILTFLDWVRLHGLCRQNKLEWRSAPAAASSLKRFAQAFDTLTRWRFFQSLKYSLIGTWLWFWVNFNTMKQKCLLIFSLEEGTANLSIFVLQSENNFHLWKSEQFSSFKVRTICNFSDEEAFSWLSLKVNMATDNALESVFSLSRPSSLEESYSAQFCKSW